MQNDNEWEIVYNELYHRNDNLSPITIYPALSRHTVEILAQASVPATWYSAGRLYCFLQDPNSSSYPRATLIENVPINISKVFRIPNDSESFWLQYHPHHWYPEQQLTVKAWIYG